VIQNHNIAVLIEPSGGSKGHGAVRSYLQSRSPQDVAIAIEDRDYRPRSIATATWANQAARNFIWRRHEIENYLVHPRVVVELFHEIRGAGAAWANSLPGTEADTDALLQTLAHPLLEDHSAEVLKDEVIRQINGIGSLSFAPPRRVPSGAHTCGQAQWMPALQQEATRLCSTCSAVAVLPDLQPAAITARYQALITSFQVPGFLTSGDYLIDMSGKSLLGALSRHLGSFGSPAGLDRDALATALLHVLERIYQPNSIYHPDDFAELAAILQQY
jgi:hypothetical protein